MEDQSPGEQDLDPASIKDSCTSSTILLPVQPSTASSRVTHGFWEAGAGPDGIKPSPGTTQQQTERGN